MTSTQTLGSSEWVCHKSQSWDSEIYPSLAREADLCCRFCAIWVAAQFETHCFPSTLTKRAFVAAANVPQPEPM